VTAPRPNPPPAGASPSPAGASPSSAGANPPPPAAPVVLYDTTLRDGTQGENIILSLADKLRVARMLDEYGMPYVEGGWPGSNPKDVEFFAAAKTLRWERAKLAAFGSTRHRANRPEADPNLRELVAAETPVVTIFGKSWLLHVTEVLGATPAENLDMIAESIAFLVERGREAVYDAEHYFDGYRADPDYALRTLRAARQAGARDLVLCDTNGGTLTHELVRIFEATRDALAADAEAPPVTLGIHTHNDAELAVANSLAAVAAGARHVQATINGYGERCGNANLASVVALLEAKLGHTTVGSDKLVHLTSVCHYIAELANVPLEPNKPFVGRSAFAHKGGMHVSAVLKDSITYEHIKPSMVGNRQRVLLSDLSGRGNVVYKLEQHGLGDRLTEEAKRELLDRIKMMEYLGYELEAAEGTFELLVREALQPGTKFFEVVSFEVGTRMIGNRESQTTATVILRVNEAIHSATATGEGPMNALDLCLRQCLSPVYPVISSVRLTDYKVRVVDTKKGTAAKVRVLIEWSDHRRSWATVGVSDNVIEASWNALLDAIRLELMRLADKDESIEKAVEDYCWGV
jgi:2-isopropylmalate synthase